MKKIRLTLEILFFAGITLLLSGLLPGAGRWLGWMAKLQFLPAVMGVNLIVIAFVLVLTLLFGRVYCSVICPLGVAQDGISKLSVLIKRARGNRKPFHFRKEHKWLRYGVWVLFVAALIAGVHAFVAVLAPYSAYGRIVSSVFQFQPGTVVLVAGVTLLVVGLLAWFTGREYCNSICPVGTTLSFFSRFALFRPVIDADKCKNCKICEHTCKASCIDIANHKIDYSRCVDCFDCLDSCKFDALKFRFAYGSGSAVSSGDIVPRDCNGRDPLAGGVAQRRSEEETAAKLPNRRAFLTGAALGLGAVALKAQDKKVDGGFAEILPKQRLDRETPITPPGSKSVKDFYRRCTACQLCVSACPNKVLRPSPDLEHLMQPEMGYENGYCRPECTKCSELCPSGAITKITPEEKTQYHIGTASVERSLCVAEKGTKCGNCARHCPVGAISMVKNEETGIRVPVVNEERCIGCGACENLCPSRPVSAITVNGRHNHLED